LIRHLSETHLCRPTNGLERAYLDENDDKQ
jgi:hypothetical protein